MNRTRVVPVVVVLAAVILLSLASTAQAQQPCPSCDRCKRIGLLFPIEICLFAPCESWGACGCLEVGDTCRLYGPLCWADCIVVY